VITRLNFESSVELFFLTYHRRLRFRPVKICFFYKNLSISITASFGVISIDSKTNISLDEMLNRVDTAVYLAKDQGRNCVCSN